MGIGQGLGTSTGVHLVSGINVVLYKYRDAVKKAPGPLASALQVKGPGNVQGIWIQFKDGVEPRTGLVIQGDPFIIGKDEVAGGKVTCRHHPLQFLNTHFLQPVA